MKTREIWLIGSAIELISKIVDAIVLAVKERKAINRLKKYERQRKKGNTDESKSRDIGNDKTIQ